jgi:AcrR family transcriptional regulator
MRTIQAITEGQGSIVEKMAQLATSFVQHFGEAPESPRFFIVMGEMALRDPELAAKLRERQGTFITEIAKLIEQGMDEGLIRRGDARTIATLLKALAALQYPVEMSALLTTGLDLILRGLVEGSTPAAS